MLPLDDATFPEPRPFQARAHESLRDGLRNGHKKQVLCAPTGAGKTYLGLRVAHEANKKGRRAMFICDRTSLIDQTSAVADRYGFPDHGVIQAQHWRTNPHALLQIASAQTLARRTVQGADVIIVDECHTRYKGWTDIVESTEAAVIGLSATPFAKGMGKMFTNLVNAATMKELTESGVLVPMRVMCAVRPDMAGAETSGGEWMDGAAAQRGMEIVGDVVSEWIERGEGRKTICFGATIAHCEEICRQFNECGVLAAIYTSNTPDAERLELLKEYRKPDSALRVLISVEALAKGFDVPDVGCVIDCRPLRKSLSTAIQMWGRGLRSSPETGKTDCILLDHSGNILRFKEDFEAIYFEGVQELDDGKHYDKEIRKEPEEKEAKGCPVCGYKPFASRCMSCGFEIVKASLIEAEPGKMVAVTIGKGTRSVSLEKRELWREVCTYAARTSEKAEGRAYHLYRKIAGEDKPRNWYFEPEIRPPSAAVIGKIKSLDIAYRKGVR